MSEMNENLIDLNYEEVPKANLLDNSQVLSGLFSCEGVVSERKTIKENDYGKFKMTSEIQTQTQDENYLETICDDLMVNLEVCIDSTPFTVTQG